MGQPLALMSYDLGRWLERVMNEELPQSLVFELELRADHNFSATVSPVHGDHTVLIGWVMEDDSTITVKALNDIPIGHKVATKEMKIPTK